MPSPCGSCFSKIGSVSLGFEGKSVVFGFLVSCDMTLKCKQPTDIGLYIYTGRGSSPSGGWRGGG